MAATTSTVFFSSFVIVMFSMVYVGFAQLYGGGGGIVASPPPPKMMAMPSPPPSLPCLQQLLPCQPYLKPPSMPPPTCCVPMIELVKNQTKCLCQVFNNADLLKSLNITQDDAFQLTKTCHANADASICKNMMVSPSGSPVTPPASNNSPPGGSNSYGAAAGVGAHLGVAASISFFIFLVLSNVGFV